MINDPFNADASIMREREFNKRKVLAVVLAFCATAALLLGYAYIRKRHAERVIANATVPVMPDTGPKGPAVAHIKIDDPMLDKGVTTIGGVVRNISKRELSGLSVALELRRRRDGKTEQATVPVEPSRLNPDEEGAYTLKLPAQTYGSIKMIGLKADPEATLIAYSSSSGKKRPPEKLEPKTIIVGKRPVKDGEFINTFENPSRVP
jgi:hypothetical protein